MQKKSVAKVIVFIGLFIALDILLTRPFRVLGSQVTFGFMSMAVAGSVLGPLLAGAAAMLSDLVGFFAFPTGQAYFIGFALTGVARAVIYGLFYYKRTRLFLPVPDAGGAITEKAKRHAMLKTVLKAALCSLVIYILNIFTIPYWYTMIMPGTYWGLFAMNLPSYSIAFPIQIVVLSLVFRYLDGFIRKNEIV